MTDGKHNPKDVPGPQADSDAYSDHAQLRRLAEKKTRPMGQHQMENLSPEEMRRVLHDLQVHQIELLMQNDELLRIRKELEQTRDKYFHLYDFAPVGYLTIGEKGLIQGANLTCAGMLGVERSTLTGKPFSHFITHDTQDVFHLHRKKLFETKTRQTCELQLVKKDGARFYARIESVLVEDGEENNAQIRTAISDISERKQAEEIIRQALSQSQNRDKEVSALLEGAKIVLNYTNFNEAARKIFDICCALTGAVAGYVALVSEDGSNNEVLFLESGGMPCTVNPDLPMPIRGLREQAYRFQKTVYDNDFSNSRWMAYMPAGHVLLDNVLFAPMVLDGKTMGVLGLANKAGKFSDNDARLISAFAELAAVSLKNSRALNLLKENEKKLQKAHDALEERVKERTRELVIANEQLVREMEELAQTEEALRHSEEKYRIVADNTSDWEFWISPESEIKYMSPSCKSITGHSREEFEADPDLLVRIIHPEDRPQFLAHQAEALGNYLPGELTFRILSAHGQERWIEHKCGPVVDKEGNFLGKRGSNRDISDRIRSEKALARNQKLASIGVLSSGLAHEINNPNNFIVFNIPVLRRYLAAILPGVEEYAVRHSDFDFFGMAFNEFKTDLFELINNIENGALRIKATVSELKDFSRQDVEERGKWANPGKTILQAARLSQGELKRYVKFFEVDIPENLPDTFFDAKGLEQVIVNLLINAAHAADKDDSRVMLRVSVTGGDTPFLVIEIQDNGCGIDEKSMEKIFDPFYTTKPSSQGTGLGLYICHTLIEAIGGRIDVESRVGEGSVFKVRLTGR